jgi:hypothetical protein
LLNISVESFIERGLHSCKTKYSFEFECCECFNWLAIDDTILNNGRVFDRKGTFLYTTKQLVELPFKKKGWIRAPISIHRMPNWHRLSK